jgi:hypothetical protein
MEKVHPKVKRKYKTKNKKEKEITFEELITIGRDMVDKDLSINKKQNLMDLMEEEMTFLSKMKKKKGKDVARSSKV